MIVTVSFFIDTPLFATVTPVRQTSATAATDTDNKYIWAYECGYI